MADPASNLLEEILRHCETAAPNPWYPSEHARTAGIVRDSLDPYLNDLRMSGLIHLTDWVKDRGQGYLLTPRGQEVLKDRRALTQVRNGNLPRPIQESEPRSGSSGEQNPWERGDSVRESLIASSPPTVTLLLIAANVLVFLYGMLLAQQRNVPLDQFLSNASDPEVLLRSGSLSARNLARGEWWRLLTNCFVHIGLLHLFFNMYGLYVIGPLLERMWGHGRYLMLYLVSGLGGSCAVMIFKPGEMNAGHLIPVNLAGASGAICGLMASAAVWVLLNRHALPRPVVSSLMRSIMINFLLIALISMFPHVSGAAHYGGAAAGAVFSLILNVERYGYGWRRVLAFLGLLLVPALSVGWLSWTMAKTDPWQRLIQRERQIQISRERSAQQNHIEQELREFNEQYFPKIEEKIRAAQKLFIKQPVILLNEPPKDPADPDVRRSKEALANERKELTTLAAQLQNAGPYEAAPLEKARQTGLQYLESWAKVLELTEELLQPGDDWLQRKEALEEQRRQLREVGERWRDLLRPKS
jgi:membrane associated rhomboid family serine protease